MKTIGWIDTLLGMLIALGSLFLPISVPAGTIAGVSNVLPDRIVNLAMLQWQSLAFHGGLALFLSGTILRGAAAVVDALRPGTAPSTPARDRDEPDLSRVARWDDETGQARIQPTAD